MNSQFNSENRLVTVSNRLPIVLMSADNGRYQVKPGAGGLVTALAPVLRNRGGMWIGWPGTHREIGFDAENYLQKETRSYGYILKPVNLNSTEISNYYKGFANQIIWPLFHDLCAYCNFNPHYWHTYKKVNQKFATIAAKNLRSEDFIWIHDYHLMGVGEELRREGVKNSMAFFLHTPFPPPDIYFHLPWRFQILNSLLAYDLIGFQTARDRRNFMQCIRAFVKDTRGSGRGQVVTQRFNGREIRIGVFPISIDFDEFARIAETTQVGARSRVIREEFPDKKIILGVDRLDYSKGIPQRLRAFRNALKRFPELREKVVFIQVVVPSRRDIPQYADLKTEIERLVGEINGEFSQSGWMPIYYIFRSLNRTELAAYYLTADMALVTPLKDGMNLIAKEYCASKIDDKGILILSEAAGTVAEFQKWAILVNPHDIEGIADAIYHAFQLPEAEQKYRMKKLRQIVRRKNIFRWVDSFLEAAFAKNLDHFVRIDDYMPTEQSLKENSTG